MSTGRPGVEPKILDRQIAALPKKIEFCRKCVVSNQRPRIVFDEEGVCSACRFAERKHTGIDWDAREKMLWELLDKHRGKDGRFVIIVPVSGGKDGGMVAYKLKHKYGMHPLTITFSPFVCTDIGYKNFRSFIDAGFDNILGTPNGQFYRKLARIGFELVGDAWLPFSFGQIGWAHQVAVKFGIPLIFYGENGEAEYGGDTGHNDRPSQNLADMENHPNMIKAPTEELIKEGLRRGLITEDEARSQVQFYELPPLEQLTRVGVEYHWFSFYEKWIPQENYYFAREHTGFEANPDGRSEGTYSKYASLDDRMDGFHYYLAFIKFGIGRCTADAAHEIRDGHITREEGMALVKRYDGELPKKHFQEFLDYIDINEDQFWQVIDTWRTPHVWTKENNEWKLRNAVYYPEDAVDPL